MTFGIITHCCRCYPLIREIIGDNGGASRNMYEGYMDKAKEGGLEGGRWGWVVEGPWWGENRDNCI